jgi:hypothetical protein
VRDTVARYNASGDQGDLDGLAGCFTPDGTLAVRGTDPWVGHDGIRAGLSTRLARAPGDERPAPTHLHHHVTGLHFVSVAADEVRTVAYFSAFTQVGLDHWGRYRDRLVPVEDRWLFTRRDVKVDGYAADSLMGQP